MFVPNFKAMSHVTLVLGPENRPKSFVKSSLIPLKPSGNNCCQRMRLYLFAETIYLTQLFSIVMSQISCQTVSVVRKPVYC